MTFQPTVFERLLFPLNKEVYGLIQKVLDTAGENRKNFNVLVRYHQSDFSIEKLQFSTDFDISLCYIKKHSDYPNGNLLSLAFNQGNVVNSFHVPLEYLLGGKNEEIIKNESNYIYSWTLYIDKRTKINSIDAEETNPYLYIGITRKSWKIRNSSHCQNMIKKPNRLLYQALNGDLGMIREKKLIIEKAGLTEDEALNIEEKEVNERSLNLLFPYGLNMIPGGYAGRNLFSKAS